jgi:Tfp pilus assembly protein PilO
MRAGMIWAASLALCLLAYVIVLRPQNKTKRRLKQNLTEQKQVYASAQRAAQEQTKIQLNEKIERLRNQLKNFAIDLEEFTDLTFDISQIASRENVASLSVKTRAKKSPGWRGGIKQTDADIHHVSENVIEIKFNAGFHQFATFVNALERHRPVLFIDEFTINRSNQDDVYQVTLDVAAFVRKQQNKETADTVSSPIFSAKI